MEEEKQSPKQTKLNMEIKVSRNYNTVTIGIQDEPLTASSNEKLRTEIQAKFKILREEAVNQLNLIGDIS